MNETELKNQKRKLVLQTVYNETGGDPTGVLEAADVAKIINIDQNEVYAIVRFLNSAKLLKIRGASGHFSITHEGVLECEGTSSIGKVDSTGVSPIHILYVENANGSQIQQGTVNSSQTIKNESTNDLIGLLATLYSEIEKSNSLEKNLALGKIEMLQVQASLPKEHRTTAIIQKTWDELNKLSIIAGLGSFWIDHGNKLTLLVKALIGI